MKSNPMEVNTNTRMRWEVLRRFPIVQAIANKSVLDIGAGLGYFSSKFAGLGANVIAVDIDQVSLKYVSDHYDISTQCADIETDDLHYKDVDLVFIGEVLEHIKDPSQFLRKVRGCLKEKGFILLTVPALEGALTDSRGKRLCHSHGAEKHERDGFYYPELTSTLQRLNMKIVQHSYCIYYLSELFMQVTKAAFSIKKKRYAGQVDVLGQADSVPYKILKTVYPIMLSIFKAEQYLCNLLPTKGHCHIILAQRED